MSFPHRLGAFLVALSLIAGPAHAATNMFIKFDGIDGSSTAAGHEKEIELLSWSHGFVQPTSPTRSTGGSGTVEQATHQNLTFTKYLDDASTALLKACWSGKQLPSATISCFRSDHSGDNQPVKYLEVAMEHVVISNYSISGGPGDIPVENISLDYGAVKYTYFDQKHPDGANGPAVQSLTATPAPALKAASTSGAPCSVKFPNGKSLEVQSWNLTSSKKLSFTTDGTTESGQTGTLTLTCSTRSFVLQDAKVVNVDHSGALTNVSVDFGAIQ
jgi:type VI secretion system secreted protein Hcp